MNSTPVDAPRPGGQELSRSVRGGLVAVAGSQAVSQVASLVVLSLLFRILGPDPFGLVGLVLPLVMFGRIFTFGGLYVAGVQHPDLAEKQASALFWLNQLVGLAASLVVAVVAPLLAWLHGVPELTPLGVALGGTLWVSTWGVHHRVLLEREMRLGLVSIVRLAALVAGGVAAIAIAWSGGGAWALVGQQYVEWIVIAGALWWLLPWRPSRPEFGADVLHLVRIGGTYTVSSVLFWAAQNVDKLVVGSLFGQRALGFYYQAYNLAMKPVTALSLPLTGVMLPALSRARGDQALFVKLLAAFWRLIALASFPLGLGLVLTAPEVMLVLGSQKWADAGPLLQVFAALILVHLFINVIGSVMSSRGHTGLLAVQAATLALGVLVALVIAWLWPGHTIETFAIAYTAVHLLIFLPYMASCLLAVHMPARAFLEAIRRPALATIAMAAVVLAIKLLYPNFTDLPPILRLAIMTTTGAATFTALVIPDLIWLKMQFLRRE